MTMRILPAVAATCALAFAGPVYAQHGNSSHAPKTPPTHVQSAATHGGGSQTHGSGAAHGSPATTTHGSSTHATTTHGSSTHATTTHGSSSHASTTKTTGSTKSKGGSHAAASTTTTTTDGTKAKRTTTTTTTGGNTTTPQLTPVQQKLLKNTNLSAKLQNRLGTSMTVQDACVGFKNLGQFVAAVNVSNNLGIPFEDLKAKMLGDTGHLTADTADDSPMSLGQAIHSLRPTVDSETEATTAQRQADATIAATTTTTTTTTSTTTKKR